MKATALMARNDIFQQKSITQYRKRFITQAKRMIFLKAQDLLLLFLKKKCFFVVGIAHGDLIFAQVEPKNSNFQRFQQNSFRSTGFQLKFLILIRLSNIFHQKPAKKIKLGVVLGQHLGQIMSNIVKKLKKQATSLGFFHILSSKVKRSGCKTT